MNFNFKKIAMGTRFRNVMTIFGILVLVIVSFQAGISVGQNKTEHAYRWNENYQSNFIPKHELLNNASSLNIPELIGPTNLGGHGLVGEVMLVDKDRQLMIRDRNNTERSITIDDKTVIRRCQQNINLKDLKNRERITTIGTPDGQGRTRADFIRVMPEKGCLPERQQRP